MGNELLSIGLSGLLTSQRGLSTTAHNIANSNTAGYSRQRVELHARPVQWNGGVHIGSGVDVADITRSYDQFLTREVQLGTSASAEYRTKHELSAQLDTLLGTSETGLSQPLQEFFNAIEDAAADPASLTARQLLLDQGAQLANRFQSLGARLQQVGDGVESRARVATDEINSLSASIADLNLEIMSSRGNGGQPNDLLDQRDELLRQLSERVSVTTLTQDDGAMNVYIGSGQHLVMGSTARELAVVTPDADPDGVGIALRQPGAAGIEVTSEIHGGTLGALLEFDQGMLEDAYRQLGQIALGLAEQVNAQHQQGMDLDGNLGGSFFTEVNAPALQTARATGDASNAGSAILQIPVTSVGDLKNSDYRLSYDGSQYSLVRESDDKVIGTYATLPIDVASEGFEIQLQSGAIAAGDQFTLRPTASALRLFEVAVPDSRSLALAAPVRSAMSSQNLGNAEIGSASVSDLAGTPLRETITLTYDEGGNQFVATAPSWTTPTYLSYDPSTDSGEILTLNVPGFGDISFSISGTPADEDSFTLADNAGGTRDNSNALLLSDLQGLGVLSGGSATFAQGYAATVSDVASRTSSFERASTTQTELLRRAEDSRASYSGVNLDEEAANIMRYQQAYEASARVVAVSNEVFQSLLHAFGG